MGLMASIYGRLAAALVLSGLTTAHGTPASSTELTVETKIPLGDISGRIDHLAVDLLRHRLYVAELGNDSIGVVDLEAGKTIRTLTGLHAPQGIGYVPSTDTLYAANAGDGTVWVLQGAELTPRGKIALGSDADNVRITSDGSRVLVGYGDGALAIIDSKTQAKLGEIPLKGHPESFRLEVGDSRIFVNVPDAHQIAVVDLPRKQTVAEWPTQNLKSNYPLALDGSGHVLAVFRSPARIGVFDADRGTLLSSVETCGDSDDLFIDSKRARVYVICGAGFVDSLSLNRGQLVRVSRIATAGGARTGLFVPETDRLYVAVRSGFGRPAAVWVLRPH
jgi:DNA-binding beta-propeller fold protein YncE